MTDATPPAPGPPAPSASFFLIALGRRARDRVEVRLHEHGIAYRHLSALGHLRRDPGLSYSELARRGGVTTQSMQTTVAHLEQRGLVERGPTTTQGRRAELRVTPRGVEVLAAAEAAVRAVDDELLDGLDPAQRALLERTLLGLLTARTHDAADPAP